MANLDIKGSFLSGPELKILTKLMGSRALAIGVTVEFWELAQEFWGRGQLVPKTAFDALDCPPALFDAGIAEKRPEGIYAKGSEDHFQWVRDRREAGRLGGIASGKSRRGELNKNNDPDEASGEATPEAQEPPNPNPTLPLTLVVEEGPKVPTPPKVKKLPRLAELWNLHKAPCQSKVLDCGSERQKKIAARWKDKPEESYWVDVLKKMAEAPLATGKGDSGWIMDFDFFIKPETATKLLEGKYNLRFQKEAPRKSAYAQEKEANRGQG